MATLLNTHIVFKKKILHGLSGLGLKASQPKVLYYIFLNEGCSQKELSQNCNEETATLSTVLSNLERKKLIIRTPNNDDRRAYKIYPTDEGRKVMELIDDEVKKAMEEALEGFTEDEVNQFSDYIDRVYKNLKELNHE